MSIISVRYQLDSITPDSLWSWLENRPGLILPASIEAISFDFYYEITGARYGFRFLPPWEVLPKGPWYVLVERIEHKPTQAKYKLKIDRAEGLLYSGELAIGLSQNQTATEIEIRLNGGREAGLADFSDEFMETILRSLIREGWEDIVAQVQKDQNMPAVVAAGVAEADEEEADHMAPLAVAAGVFSAGMALSLWMWRRKRRDPSI